MEHRAPTPEEMLANAKAGLAAFQELGGPPEAIAFWEDAVRDCEDLKHKPVLEKGE